MLLMGDFGVTLEFKILTYAQYAAVFHSSQALKSPHYKHLFGENKGNGDFGVTLEFKILTYAQYAAVFHSSQALKSPHYKHLFGENKGMGNFGVTLEFKILTYYLIIKTNKDRIDDC